jgi:hypothetical protein
MSAISGISVMGVMKYSLSTAHRLLLTSSYQPTTHNHQPSTINHQMRFTTSILLIILLAAAAEYFFPWWTIAVVAFIIAFIAGLRPGKAFLSGVLGIGLLWLGWALWADMANDHILSSKMAALFKLPNYILFIVVTVFVGALVGGLSALSGALVKRAVAQK